MIKTTARLLLLLSAIATAQAATLKVSQLPSTNALKATDMLYVEAQASGTNQNQGVYINYSNLVQNLQQSIFTTNLLIVNAGDNLSNVVAQAPNSTTIRVRGRHTVTPFTNTATTVRAPLILAGKTNVILEGDGFAEISGTGPGNFLWVTLCDHVIVRGLQWVGSKPLTSCLDTTNTGLYAAINLWGTNNAITVEGNRIQHMGNHGISYVGPEATYYATNICVQDNKFFNGGATNRIAGQATDGPAIQFPSLNATVRRNTIRYWARGIELQGDPAAPQKFENNVIEDNVLEDIFGDLGIFVVEQTTSPAATNITHIAIRRNRIRGGSGFYYPIYASIGCDIDIEQNYVRSPFRGIEVNVTTYAVRKMRIVGNSVYDVTGNDGFGIVIGGAAGADSTYVAGNRVQNVHGSGIFLSFSRNGRVVDNTVVDCPKSDGNQAPIYVLGNGTNNFVEFNNIFVETSVAAGRGIVATAPLTTVRKNRITGYATPVDFQSTGDLEHDFVSRTTDATVTTLYTLTPPNGAVVHASLEVYGTSTSATNVGAYVRTHLFRKAGGTVSAVGSETAVQTQEDNAGWDSAIAASGGTVLFRVTGNGSTTIDWSGKARASVR